MLAARSFICSARKEFWAVRGVNLAIPKGAFIGVIGPNGSGKSTLLKMLSGIVKPTEGTCETRGRVATLMEVGAGFHPDLTGWENIFLYGSVLGIPRKETRERLGEIVAFSGLEERFLDMPLKYYSSGMHARLGFSVAIHTQPDILLIDEILAVGDMEFQVRSFERIHQMHQAGVTILLVTHDVPIAGVVCQEILRMNEGRVVDQGEPAKVVAAHKREMTLRAIERIAGGQGRDSSKFRVPSSELRTGSSELRVPGSELRTASSEPRIAGSETGVPSAKPQLVGSTFEMQPSLFNEQGLEIRPSQMAEENESPVYDVCTGERLAIAIRVGNKSERAVNDLQFMIFFLRDDGMPVAEMDSSEQKASAPLAADGAAAIRIEFDPFVIKSGQYSMGILLYDGPDRDRALCVRTSLLRLRVAEDQPNVFSLLAEPKHEWKVVFGDSLTA
ncbi:MAG: polysaccharide ABC transporter ATP-binding protein [Candidatus Sumerlaeota bacterium]|nr:polysaccharide ABC transporter ATP-binding protein [Candidatus Sumerlaeota bacterium]